MLLVHLRRAEHVDWLLNANTTCVVYARSSKLVNPSSAPLNKSWAMLWIVRTLYKARPITHKYVRRTLRQVGVPVFSAVAAYSTPMTTLPPLTSQRHQKYKYRRCLLQLSKFAPLCLQVQPGLDNSCCTTPTKKQRYIGKVLGAPGVIWCA